MFRKAIAAFAGMVLIGCSTVQEQSQAQITPLEMEDVFSLKGSDCACLFFEAGPVLSFNRVLLSTTSTDARAVVSGSMGLLHNIASDKVGERWSNTYSAKDSRITVESTEVPFNTSCAQYPDPPSHGTCFVGELHVVSEGVSQFAPVVGVCGC